MKPLWLDSDIVQSVHDLPVVDACIERLLIHLVLLDRRQIANHPRCTDSSVMSQFLLVLINPRRCQNFLFRIGQRSFLLLNFDFFEFIGLLHIDGHALASLHLRLVLGCWQSLSDQAEVSWALDSLKQTELAFDILRLDVEILQSTCDVV